jgi:hypothetical protein
MAPVYTLTLDRERREIDVSRKILELYPNKQPFIVLLSRMSTEGLESPEFNVWEYRAYAYYTQINNVAGYDAAAVAFVVDDETVFVADDLLFCPRTGETMIVESTTTATHTVTVKARSNGTVAAAALVDGDYVVRLGNAHAERTGAPASRLAQPEKYTGYAQIFKHSFDGSWTQEKEKLKAGTSERRRQSKLKGMEHEWDIERAFLWGEASEAVDASGRPLRTTGGANEAITTNVKDLGGVALSAADMNEICEIVFAKGTGEKIMFPCPALASQLSDLGQAKMQLKPGEKKYGVNLTEWISPHGTLQIAPPCQSFTGPFADRSFVFDMDNVKRRNYRPTKLQTNLQAADVDGYLDQYLSETGFQCTMEETHLKLINIKIA